MRRSHGIDRLLSIEDLTPIHWNFLLEDVIGPSGTYPFPEHFRRLAGEDFSVAILKKWLAKGS